MTGNNRYAKPQVTAPCRPVTCGSANRARVLDQCRRGHADLRFLAASTQRVHTAGRGMTAPALDTDPWLTAREVAEHFRVPVKTIREWRYQGTGPHGVRIGRHLRYRLSEIRRWEREQERQR